MRAPAKPGRPPSIGPDLTTYPRPHPRCIATFKCHSRRITSVAMSADGRNVVSGAADRAVCVTDVAAGSSAVLSGSPDYVLGVALSPDGRWVASCDEGRAVRLWTRV